MGFKVKNDDQTTSEQLQKHFEKVQKMSFFTLKMVKIALSEGQNLTLSFDCRGNIPTFRAENTPARESFKPNNNTLNNFLTTPNEL